MSNRINCFHAHSCNHGHAKTQTADHADRTDHVERALFGGEFRLLQLARHGQIHSWPITKSTSTSLFPSRVRFSSHLFFTLKFFRLLCEDSIPLNQRHTQITCRVGPWTRETWACDFCFANKSSKWHHKISSCGVQSAECSSLKWSMVCKFGGTKEIVYINEAFKSHRIFFRTPTWRRTTRFQ